MALNYNGKICRNLQEQVWENVKDIEDLKDDFDTLTSGSMVSGLVLKGVVASVADLDDIENPVKNGLYMVEPNKLYVYDGVEFVYETEFGKGEKGDTGEQGPVGEQGPQGIQGPQGNQGPIGPQGPKGDSGTSFVITGEVDSAAELPDVSSLALGTAYFVGAVNPKDVYVVVMNEGVKVWSNEGALQGPVGPQGPQGVQGIQGIQGERGVQGEQGIQGPAGADGEDGTDGVNGADGITPHIDSTTGNWFLGNTDTGVHAQGPAGQNGANGQDGLTTRISVNGNTYTQVGGLITLPNYPSGAEKYLTKFTVYLQPNQNSTTDKIYFTLLVYESSSRSGGLYQMGWSNLKNLISQSGCPNWNVASTYNIMIDGYAYVPFTEGNYYEGPVTLFFNDNNDTIIVKGPNGQSKSYNLSWITDSRINTYHKSVFSII